MYYEETEDTTEKDDLKNFHWSTAYCLDNPERLKLGGDPALTLALSAKFCSDAEIERECAPQTAVDTLLKLPIYVEWYYPSKKYYNYKYGEEAVKTHLYNK